MLLEHILGYRILKEIRRYLASKRELLSLSDRMKKINKIAIILLQILLPLLSLQEKSYSQELKQEHCLLRSRICYSFPDGTEMAGKNEEQYSGAIDLRSEVTFTIKSGKINAIITIKDLFKTADTGIISLLMKKRNDTLFKNEIYKTAEGFSAFISTSQKYDSLAEAILLNSMLVREPSGLLHQVSFYINNIGFSKRKNYTEISNRIFKSIKKGLGTPNLTAHREKIDLQGLERSISLELPSGFILSQDSKENYVIFYLNRIQTFTDTNLQKVTICIGKDPAYFFGQYKLDINQSTRRQGRLLSHDIQWLQFYIKQRHFYLLEQKVPCKSLGEGISVLVTIAANEMQSLDNLLLIAKDLKITR